MMDSLTSSNPVATASISLLLPAQLLPRVSCRTSGFLLCLLCPSTDYLGQVGTEGTYLPGYIDQGDSF